MTIDPAVNAPSSTSTSTAPTPGREVASATIWRASPAPSTAPIRRRALVRWLVGCSVGAAFYSFGHLWLALIAWSLSTLIFALALLSPLRAHAAFERGLVILTHGIGRILTWILLAPVFYLILTPFGLLRRRGERDTLTRRFEPDRKSYWTKRTSEPNPLEHPY